MATPRAGGRRIAGLRGAKQGRSQCYRFGDPRRRGRVAQIFFPTNVAVLDSDDTSALDELTKVFEPLLLGRRIHFTFEGHADYRGETPYNLGLSERRAKSVQSYVKQRLGPSSFFTSSVDPRGEQGAGRHSLYLDRRVDVLSSFVPKRRIRLPAVSITGRVPKPDPRLVMLPTQVFKIFIPSRYSLDSDIKAGTAGDWQIMIVEKLESYRDDCTIPVEKVRESGFLIIKRPWWSTSSSQTNLERVGVHWRKRTLKDTAKTVGSFGLALVKTYFGVDEPYTKAPPVNAHGWFVVNGWDHWERSSRKEFKSLGLDFNYKDKPIQ